MSVFSSGKRSTLTKKSSLSSQSTKLNVPPAPRIVNVEKQKAVRFELLKNLDVQSVLQNVSEEQEQKDYDVLIRIIRDTEYVVQDAELLKLLTCAKNSVQFLNEKLKLFVQVLLLFKWNTCGSPVVKAYEAFILELCKEQPFYKSLVVEQLVLSLTKVTEPDKINEWTNGLPPASDQAAYVNIHSLLFKLLSSSLISPELLIEKAWSLYPHHNLPSAFLAYTHNLLELSIHSSMDPCRKQIFSLIIQKLIHLDTLATKEEIEKAESDHQENLLSSADIFNMDDESSSEPALVMHHSVANLLDLCLLRFLRYIQSICFEPKHLASTSSSFNSSHSHSPSMSRLTPSCSSKKKSNGKVTPEEKSKLENPLNDGLLWDQTKILFNELLSVFESTILPTHNIFHVPFLLFYFASLRLSIAENLIEFLWKKIVNERLYNIVRTSCANYVSSLLIHGHFMPVRVIKACLNEMALWLHAYLDRLDLTNEEVLSPVRHPVFYSVCQVLFAVIAYKHSILVDTKKNMKFLSSLNVNRLITSPLNPLRSCDSTIVSHFAAVTNTYQIVYCYNVIAQNERLNILPIIATDSTGNVSKLGAMTTVDLYYSPFSNFLLLRCKSIITPEILCGADSVSHCDSPSRTRDPQIASPTRELHDEDDFLMSVDTPALNSSVNMSVSA